MLPSIGCIIGPTASGKSQLALHLAACYDAEIISVDSALIYRHMNIGSAKPSLEERQQIPHHLIDIINPTDRYSAANFCTDATKHITRIMAKGKMPLLVGGTMLYIYALEVGLSHLPCADLTLRAQLDEEAQLKGWPALHKQLQAIDPIAASRIAPYDKQRIQRALEIFLLSGHPLTTLLKKKSTPSSFKLLKMALVPAERAWLRDRITHRFRHMLNMGLVEEVKTLRTRFPNLTPALPAIRTVGYRQAWQYLDNQINYDTFVTQAITATHQLAKRQLTWLNKLQNLTLLNCQDKNQLPALAEKWFRQHILPIS
ncbi:MAG: tRNA (adenosine(37)-N6)-dimethylallyltransferase MiaA [Neisseriales bacterium]|nr:MAG: tRNA (adenosine(37)-N6)-dimethylallyltransferase MiaA [Neisseriales bacterium]